MKRFLLAAPVALALTGLVASVVLGDASGHKADCQKQWGHCPWQAKPSPTLLPSTPCPQPCLPYQGPGPAPRYYAPLPDGCYHPKRECEPESCGCKLLDKLRAANRANCNGCDNCK
jgi:hypothetical protein